MKFKDFHLPARGGGYVGIGVCNSQNRICRVRWGALVQGVARTAGHPHLAAPRMTLCVFFDSTHPSAHQINSEPPHASTRLTAVPADELALGCTRACSRAAAFASPFDGRTARHELCRASPIKQLAQARRNSSLARLDGGEGRAARTRKKSCQASARSKMSGLSRVEHTTHRFTSPQLQL